MEHFFRNDPSRNCSCLSVSLQDKDALGIASYWLILSEIVHYHQILSKLIGYFPILCTFPSIVQYCSIFAKQEDARGWRESDQRWEIIRVCGRAVHNPYFTNDPIFRSCALKRASTRILGFADILEYVCAEMFSLDVGCE